MPKQSTSGQTILVAHIKADHTFSPAETFASLNGFPSSGNLRITLPGPVSTPDNLPNDGDRYALMDPDGFSETGASGTGVIIDFGGSKFDGSTAPFGPVSFAAFIFAFVFDAELGAWSIEEG
jgi:hypothetical protein